MTLIDFDKKELTDIAHALLCYRTDSTIIDPKGNGLTDEQKALYTRLSKLMDKVSQLNNVCEILDGEIKYSTLLDHTGDQKRRISITYKDKK